MDKIIIMKRPLENSSEEQKESINNESVNNDFEPEEPDSEDEETKESLLLQIPTEVGPISDDPNKIHSHFVRISDTNRKGQSRFKCVKCDHTFECSGQKRLLQHILGYSHQANRYKNVRACPNPHAPLKEALMKLYPRQSTDSIERKRKRKTRKDDMSLSLWEELTAAAAELQNNGIQVSGFPLPPSIGGFSRLRQHNPFTGISIQQKPKTVPMPTNRLHYCANQTLYQLLANHGLSVSIVEDPIFGEFLNAVRMAGNDYQPTTQTLIQDNLLNVLLTNDDHSHIGSVSSTATSTKVSSSFDGLSGSLLLSQPPDPTTSQLPVSSLPISSQPSLVKIENKIDALINESLSSKGNSKLPITSQSDSAVTSGGNTDKTSSGQISLLSLLANSPPFASSSMQSLPVPLPSCTDRQAYNSSSYVKAANNRGVQATHPY